MKKNRWVTLAENTNYKIVSNKILEIKNTVREMKNDFYRLISKFNKAIVRICKLQNR